MKTYLTQYEFNTIDSNTLYPGAEFVINDIGTYPVWRWNGTEFVARVEAQTDPVTGGIVLLTGDGSQIKIIPGELCVVASGSFSVPNGYTSGSVATPVDLSTTVIDTLGTLANLADNSVNVPANATHVRVSANVSFAANATGYRYVALEQYFQAITTWMPLSGFYDEKSALSGVATPISFNASIGPVSPSNFPKLRLSVGQNSGGALNCTVVSASFEFITVT